MGIIRRHHVSVGQSGDEKQMKSQRGNIPLAPRIKVGYVVLKFRTNIEVGGRGGVKCPQALALVLITPCIDYRRVFLNYVHQPSKHAAVCHIMGTGSVNLWGCKALGLWS